MDANEIILRLKNLKGAKTECSQCGCTKWSSPPHEGRAVLTIAYRARGEKEERDVIAFICDNCGFVRFHEESKLHD